jgi:hypothetical protein
MATSSALSTGHRFGLVALMNLTQKAPTVHMYHDWVVLSWDHGHCTCTVPLDSANCFTLPLASPTNAFESYVSNLPFSLDDPSPQFCCQPAYTVWDHQPPVPLSLSPDKSNGPTHMANPFDLEGDKVELTVTMELTLGTPMKEDSAKLLCYHYKYGHIPFRRLQEMAAQWHTTSLPYSLCHPTLCHLPIWQGSQAS